MTKRVDELKVGDVILGIGSTTFNEPHTVVKVSTYRWDGEEHPAAVITDKGGFYDFNMVGRHAATVR